jgi:hypothetical protein
MNNKNRTLITEAYRKAPRDNVPNIGLDVSTSTGVLYVGLQRDWIDPKDKIIVDLFQKIKRLNRAKTRIHRKHNQLALKLKKEQML